VAPGGAPRERAQKDAAYSSAIQAAAKERYEGILATVVRPMEGRLDAIFDFGSLMLPQGQVQVIPPVLSSAGSALRVEGGGRAATSQEGSILMVSKARIVPGPPNWRNYLFLDMPVPDETHPSLLPVGAREISLWRERVARGWEVGISQADALFKSQVARLVRDYCGLLLYQELKGDGRVSPPELKEAPLGTVLKEGELVEGLTGYELLFEGGFRESGKAKGPGSQGKGK
jgi:defect-in-organelle-trafficking protein DotC